ncbi:MAG: RDD family protein [Gammaproteobacteria bacterium]|nr:RDD family protein [Gammaproteobacteria bacterium]MBT8445413.1 RDD family protein [Gammaproteobacteria bacterium]NND37554.1 RDD family protein [Gammaproteobacteria bacterium]
MPDSQRYPPAGLPRRLAAFIYDGLLVLGLLVIPTLVAIAMRGGESIPPGSLLFQLLLIVTAGGFFIWFWTHGGQTLGMRSWRLRVERQSGEPLSYRHALVRFLVGILSIAAGGLGLLWILIDPDKLAWHDRAADTRVVILPGKKN